MTVRYSELDREMKTLAKKDKKAYIKRLAEEAEDAAGRQDLKTMYRITKTIKGGSNSSDGLV